MKKKVMAILLAAALLVILPAVAVAAQETTVHEITFNIDTGKYWVQNHYLHYPAPVDADATFSGQIKQKNGNWYLFPSPPMEGIITIDGVQHEIVVKQLYHPPRVNYRLINDTTYKSEQWYYRVEVNIEEDTYTGYLWFWLVSDKVNGKLVPREGWGQTQLYVDGIRADGKIVTFYTYGASSAPVIE